jgi:hypothetical protein
MLIKLQFVKAVVVVCSYNCFSCCKQVRLDEYMFYLCTRGSVSCILYTDALRNIERSGFKELE